jgi:hypothetical protein
VSALNLPRSEQRGAQVLYLGRCVRYVFLLNLNARLNQVALYGLNKRTGVPLTSLISRDQTAR